MRRNITIKTLLLLSLFVTGAAWAEWREVDKTDSFTFYIDLATLRKEDNLRKIWLLANATQRSVTGSISTLSKYEYDCKNDRYRSLAFSAYSEPMATGKMIDSINGEPTVWREIVPESSGYLVSKIVCAR